MEEPGKNFTPLPKFNMKEEKIKEEKRSKKTKEEYEAKIKDLEEKTEDMEKKIKTLENDWKRALADYKNLEKRIVEEREKFLVFTKIQIIESFLPFFDNLEKIEEHIKDEGLNLTIKELKKTLKSLGVEEVETDGKEFDPMYMEAVEMQKGEKNKVLKTYQKGYLINGNLIRPAKVVVGQE